MFFCAQTVSVCCVCKVSNPDVWLSGVTFIWLLCAPCSRQEKVCVCVCMCVRERERARWPLPFRECVQRLYIHVYVCVCALNPSNCFLQIISPFFFFPFFFLESPRFSHLFPSRLYRSSTSFVRYSPICTGCMLSPSLFTSLWSNFHRLFHIDFFFLTICLTHPHVSQPPSLPQCAHDCLKVPGFFVVVF